LAYKLSVANLIKKESIKEDVIMAEAALKQTAANMEKRNFSEPDEIRNPDKGKLEIVTLDGVTFARVTAQPGWKWSTSVKPLVNTQSCEVSHLGYIVSGHMHVMMDDGSEEEFGPGDIFKIPSGHDAWVMGNEPLVAIDIGGLGEYARSKME
jgi:mannose-6-phosphate isomerase-like protein (cupin superfamily)